MLTVFVDEKTCKGFGYVTFALMSVLDYYHMLFYVRFIQHGDMIA